ncbi:ALP1-like protein isoform X1 [Tanacetum coccineum]
MNKKVGIEEMEIEVTEEMEMEVTKEMGMEVTEEMGVKPINFVFNFEDEIFFLEGKSCLKVGKASEVPFVANDVTYKWGYYLTDEIYPEWAVLMKSISQPGSNDVKRIRFKRALGSRGKDGNDRLAC